MTFGAALLIWKYQIVFNVFQISVVSEITALPNRMFDKVMELITNQKKVSLLLLRAVQLDFYIIQGFYIEVLGNICETILFWSNDYNRF